MPQLIVLDIMLPKLNGVKICQILKGDDIYTHIPIILVSSRSGEDDDELLVDLKAEAFISKTEAGGADFFLNLIEHVHKFILKKEPGH